VVIVLWPKLGVTGAGINAATLTASAAAVLAISSGTVWQKKFGTRADPLANAAWQYIGAALVMAIGSALFETRQFTLNGELVFALLWLTLVLSIGAIFLLMRMIREGEMARVSSLFYLVPSVTAVIAWMLFGETLTLVQIVGMIVATFGVALATSRKPR
jgi:drug/metabolite transporter (DMT)-like permease